MKKTLLFLGTIAVSAVTSGVTVWAVDRSHTDKIEYIEREVERTPALGSHFTAYEADKYPDLTYAAENAVKAVVNIEAIQQVDVSSGYGGGAYDPFFEFFGIPQGYGRRGGQPQTQERRAGGSGVIISDDGYIVTNNHVIEDATKLRVKLNDGRKFDAKVIGTDPTTDVALIKAEGKDLPTIPFGNSEGLRLGEWVLAIGSPFDLQSTITAGIVSAKARQLDVIPDQFRIESFIQTDAAVNPGNSGGALVNTKGELVGINTLIQSRSGTYIGYAFAVPTSIVKKVVVDLKEHGVVQRAMLGIQYIPLTEEFLETEEGKKTGIQEPGGIYVAEVDPEGAAHAAGIRSGDVIVEINGIKIDGSAQLSEEIAKHRPNDKVTVGVKKGSDVKQIEVVLRNKAGNTEVITKDIVSAYDALGGQFAEVSERTKKALKIGGGVQVVGIEPGGILESARIRKGYIITNINDRPVRSIGDLNRITSKIEYIEGVYPDGRVVAYSPTVK